MNYKIIRHILAQVLRIEAASMVLPLVCAVLYKETNILTTWFLSIFICVAASFLISYKTPAKKEFYAREGFVAVALSWIFLSIFGALPFFISRYIPNFVDAVFETASGFTTTGASILTNVEALPNSLLFWRSFTHWIGGMGVLVFMVAILPMSGGNNFFLIKAESPGPSVSKLGPRVKHPAKLLYQIYIALTIVQIVLLLCGGMKIFDALTLSFGTAGTGGFGIRNDSIASYSSYIQWVIGIFMVLYGINFTFYFLLLIRKPKKAFSMEEVRAYLIIIACAVLIIMFDMRDRIPVIWDNLRYAFFQVGAVITTTGYATADFNNWNMVSRTVLVLLMFIGACAGSTGGGIKVSRILIMWRTVKKEIKQFIHPNRVGKVTLNDKTVAHEVVRSVNVFVMAYLFILALSVVLISVDGYDFTTNFTAIVSALNNIGPGLELVGPAGNFAHFSAFSKIVLMFDMLAGRLEIFPLLVLFRRETWRKF